MERGIAEGHRTSEMPRGVMEMTDGSDDGAKGRVTAPAEGRGASFKFRYVGDRFADAGLPFDMLSDLEALRDLVAALAEEEFRRKRGGRPPLGFNKAISLALVGIRGGGTVPEVAFQSDAARRSLPEFGDELDDLVVAAFDRVVMICDGASHDGFPDIPSPKAVGAMSKFGANLLEGEHMEFPGKKGRSGGKVIWDRKRLENFKDTHQRSVSEAFDMQLETRRRKFDGIGPLAGVDTVRNSVQVQTDEHGDVWLPLGCLSRSISQFSGNLFAPVEFSASIAVNADGKLINVEEVYSVDLFEQRDGDVWDRIVRLRELFTMEKGWLGNGQGEESTPVAILRAANLVFKRRKFADLFRIYPTGNGGISVEFDKGGWNFCAEMMPDGSIEIDRSLPGEKTFEIESFDGMSQDFFNEFDRMTAVTG